MAINQEVEEKTEKLSVYTDKKWVPNVESVPQKVVKDKPTLAKVNTPKNVTQTTTTIVPVNGTQFIVNMTNSSSLITKPEFDHQVKPLKVTDEIVGHADHPETPSNSSAILLSAEAERITNPEYKHFVGKSVGKTENPVIKAAILAAQQQANSTLLTKMGHKAMKGLVQKSADSVDEGIVIETAGPAQPEQKKPVHSGKNLSLSKSNFISKLGGQNKFTEDHSSPAHNDTVQTATRL